MKSFCLPLITWLALIGCGKVFGLLVPRTWNIGRAKYVVPKIVLPRIHDASTTVAMRPLKFRLYAINTIISPFDASRKDEIAGETTQVTQYKKSSPPPLHNLIKLVNADKSQRR